MRGIKHTWTDDDTTYLTANFGIIGAQHIAKYIGCNKDTIYDKAIKLGLHIPKVKVIIKQKRLRHPKGELARALGIGFSPWGS